MKLRSYTTATIAIVLATFGATWSVFARKSQALAFEKAKFDLEQKKIQENTEADQKLGQYTINLISRDYPELDNSKKQILARMIVQVASDMFTDPNHKKAFVAVISIESKFHRDARSPTGAVGLTQIIPNYANDHGRPCEIYNVKPEDLLDAQTNLAVGACYFRFLLERYNGDIFAAISGYNAGHNSKTAEIYSKSGDMSNAETLRYIAKFVFLYNNVPDNKQVEPKHVKTHVVSKEDLDSDDKISQ
ncbi:LT_GEWL domain containing protein [uncultured Caudovirales phage]|uniref:LT_GEWL domain containing protein n=1 Tax=uncultured Caudovirales phage TaxID=2100421 RepID=A0A6J7WVS8_9CAUD|nr:LT_GEWL domain containing protein [uncultured Caudovirales phage]